MEPRRLFANRRKRLNMTLPDLLIAISRTEIRRAHVYN
jgi:hypothetical protein